VTQVKTRERGVQYGDGGEQANPNNHNSWEFGAHLIVGTVCAYDASSDLHAYPLKYVNVTVSGCKCVALEDSGCQIPIVSRRLFAPCCNGSKSNITLRGFGKGQTVRAPLRNLTVCLNDVESGNVREIPIVCAVTDLCSADYDVILPVDVVRSLHVTAGTASVSVCVTSDVRDVTTKSDPPKVKGNPLEKVDSLLAGPEKSGGNLTNPVWSNVCIFAQTTLSVCLLLMLLAISIAVCFRVQYSTKGVTSGTHTARRCANAAVSGINPVQCFTRLPVCVSLSCTDARFWSSRREEMSFKSFD